MVVVRRDLARARLAVLSPLAEDRVDEAIRLARAGILGLAAAGRRAAKADEEDAVGLGQGALRGKSINDELSVGHDQLSAGESTIW